MIIEENTLWFQEKLRPVLFEELRQLKEILLSSSILAFVVTGIVVLLFPQHFAHVDITATGRKGSQTANAAVAWLSLPDLSQIDAQELEVRKSRGWEKNKGFLTSTRSQPAELQLTGYFFLSQALQFVSTPHSGEVEIETNGTKRTVNLFHAGQNVKAIPLNHVSKNRRGVNRVLSEFLIGSAKHFLMLTCLLVVLRIAYLKLQLLRNSINPYLVKAAFVIGCAVLAASLLFLGSPRAPDALISSGDVFVYDIRGPFHLTINVDSWDFLDIGRDPRLMFTEKHQRFQGRPLYSTLGFLLSLPFRPFRSEWIAAVFNPVAYYFPEILGYAILNTIVLTISIVIFYRLVENKLSFDWVLLLPLTIFTANEVTKAFFWTPHLQVFNLFIPLLSILFYWWMIQRIETFRVIHILLIGGLLGFSALAYPGFGSMLLGTMLLVLVKSRKKYGALLLPLSFYLPILAWRGVVLLLTGSFYDAEVVEGRLFTWVTDIFRDFDAFKVAFVKNVGDFSLILLQVMSVPAIILFSLMAVRFQYQRIQPATPKPMPDELRISFWIYYASTIPFLFLIGIYRTRLTYCLVPPVLVLIGRELKFLEGILTSRRVMVLKIITTMFSFGYLIYWVLRKGPWS